ncbi:MAG TPA: serine hydrolase [Rhizomicrobium sp.]|nr:serine hydrolase [Rhizomicrobium sp.]
MQRLSRLGLVLSAVLLSASPAFAQIDLPVAAPAEVGMSAEKLDRVTEALQAHVDAGDIAGAVGGVVRDGKLVYLKAVGQRDIGSSSPMNVDALFRIYSMTRPIPALGILMLQDDGKVNVNDPVKKYLPKFADQRVLADANAPNWDQTRPRQGDITLANLSTHTAGFGGRETKIYVDHNVRRWDLSLSQVVDNMAGAPLFEDPGTKYRYSEGGDVQGRVIELQTGMKLDEFYRQRIFGPLGMTDTMFYVDPAHAGRLATTYRPVDGKLQAFEIEPIPPTERRALISAVGAISSTRDMLRFGQFFLNNGRVNGKQLLSAEGVRLAETNALPAALLPISKTGYNAGSGWSLGGFNVVMDPTAYDHTVNKGEFWWDGSSSTRLWIDPKENMVTVIMAALQPTDGKHFREQFKTLVYAAIEKPKP